MTGRKEPITLAQAISKLITQRGLVKEGSDVQLQQIWKKAVGGLYASRTRALKIKDGILIVAVEHAALLSELESFHKKGILDRLHSMRPDFNLKGIKFVLQGRLNK